MRLDRIPLFPLNVVLLPGTDLPLHIFEPRYRRMVKNCLREKSPFGILLVLPRGTARVGCAAEITKVLKEYEDGRFDILTCGREPFRVSELFTEDPLLEGAVEYLEDEDAPSEPPVPQQLLELYEACYALIFADYPKSVDANSPSLSYHITASLPMDLLWKQNILELRGESVRRERLLHFLREWAPHLQRSSNLKKRAAGNGHGLN
jgi:ATP-dependent Lon protease